MDWFGKDVKDNSLKRKFSEKPVTDTIINFCQIMIRNKLRSIILFFVIIILFSIIFFKISQDEEEIEDKPTRNVPWIYKNKDDRAYFNKRDEICQEFKMKNHEKFRGKPIELSIATILPTRNDEEMYNIFQSALFAMEHYLMKFPANMELYIVEWGADQTFKRKIDIPCSFAKVERIFVGDWLVDGFKKRSNKQQMWEIQMAANIGLHRLSTNNTLWINYNDILTGTFFQNFRELLKNLESTPSDKLPIIQPIPKRKVPFLFQGGVSPARMAEALEKVEWENVAQYEQEIDNSNKNNDFPNGDYYTTSWLTDKETWNLLRGYPEVPINIDWHPVLECYAKEKIHPKIKTPKNFYPYIITIPASSYQIALWKDPHKLANTEKWCKTIFTNNECWGIANKLMRRSGYNYGSLGDEGDTPKIIDKEPQLRACEEVKIHQRDFFTHLLANLDSTSKTLE